MPSLPPEKIEVFRKRTGAAPKWQKARLSNEVRVEIDFRAVVTNRQPLPLRSADCTAEAATHRPLFQFLRRDGAMILKEGRLSPSPRCGVGPFTRMIRTRVSDPTGIMDSGFWVSQTQPTDLPHYFCWHSRCFLSGRYFCGTAHVKDDILSLFHDRKEIR
jgi:hypothetical protein